MKKLTCEMCGSTDLVKQDGVFVCQSCGCKYSVEEAKKMMVEGTVEVTGTVKVDNSGAISNYLEMARSAIASGNHKEAESYCNKIIEMDFDNWEAWFLKGKSVGWQSTLASMRVSEAINCFAKASDNCSSENRDKLYAECKQEIQSLQGAILSLRLDNFDRFISDEVLGELGTDIEMIKSTSADFLAKMHSEEKALQYTQFVQMYEVKIVGTWNQVLREYEKEKPYPSDYVFTKLFSDGDIVVDALQLGLTLCRQGDENLIMDICDQLCAIEYSIIGACSYTVTFIGGVKRYVKSKELADSAIANRHRMIDGWRSQSQAAKNTKRAREIEEQKRVQEQEEKERKARYQAFWKEHAEERAKLETEKEHLNLEIKKIDEQLNPLMSEKKALEERKGKRTPAEQKLFEVKSTIDDLKREKSKLSLFAGKRKKEIQSEVDTLCESINQLELNSKEERETLDSEIAEEIEKIQHSIDDLMEKLSKAEKSRQSIENALSRDR